jgi:hypothetical protein
MGSSAVATGQEELIGTLDIGHLHEIRWPFMRLLAGRYAEEMEVCRYMRTLLATRRWAVVRMLRRSTNALVVGEGGWHDPRTQEVAA